MVEFVVEKNGSIRDVKLVKGIGGGCDEETTRVITSMQNDGIAWVPGMHNGKPVHVKMILPVKYELD